MQVECIRRELRSGDSAAVRNSRRIAVLAAVGAVDFAIISLYQVGALRHLPDPPGRWFDSDKVNAARKAYALGVPDATLGLTLYGVILMLASAGGTPRSGRSPVFDVLLATAVLAGAGASLDYLWNMARRQERACPYCLLGAATHFAMLPLALPRAWAALRERKSIARGFVK